MEGRLVSIWIKPFHRGPMRRVDSAELVAGGGLRGSADQGGKRQITIISEGSWGEAQEELGVAVDPSARRANVLLRGVDLESSRGRMLRLGDCVVRVDGEVHPCERMEQAQAGLRAALEPRWRGGVFGEIIEGGTIRVGDCASWATHLDRLMPAWQFRERHATHVEATPEKVFAAIRAVRAEDILFFRTLVAIRRGWRSRGESILSPPKGEPVLDVATRSGFRYVADDAPREIVVSTSIAQGTEAMMNFLVTPDERGGSSVSTETRVHATTPRGKRLFAMYWFAIRLGSGLIRRMWLRAIKRRAEA